MEDYNLQWKIFTNPVLLNFDHRDLFIELFRLYCDHRPLLINYLLEVKNVEMLNFMLQSLKIKYKIFCSKNIIEYVYFINTVEYYTLLSTLHIENVTNELMYQLIGAAKGKHYNMCRQILHQIKNHHDNNTLHFDYYLNSNYYDLNVADEALYIMLAPCVINTFLNPIIFNILLEYENIWKGKANFYQLERIAYQHKNYKILDYLKDKITFPGYVSDLFIYHLAFFKFVKQQDVSDIVEYIIMNYLSPDIKIKQTQLLNAINYIISNFDEELLRIPVIEQVLECILEFYKVDLLQNNNKNINEDYKETEKQRINKLLAQLRCNPCFSEDVLLRFIKNRKIDKNVLRSKYDVKVQITRQPHYLQFTIDDQCNNLEHVDNHKSNPKIGSFVYITTDAYIDKYKKWQQSVTHILNKRIPKDVIEEMIYRY